jgi:hypothetical protein
MIRTDGGHGAADAGGPKTRPRVQVVAALVRSGESLRREPRRRPERPHGQAPRSVSQ